MFSTSFISKRTQEFADLWCSLFTTEPEIIIKHCSTRWLSLLHCVGRYLNQLDGLKSFFRSTNKETCNENTTCELCTKMNRLLKVYAANILKRDVITAAGDNLSLLNLSEENQLSNENLGIGTRTWTDLVELEAEHDLKPFFSVARKFHGPTINKNAFGDSLLNYLEILHSERTASYSVDRIQYWLSNFDNLD